MINSELDILRSFVTHQRVNSAYSFIVPSLLSLFLTFKLNLATVKQKATSPVISNVWLLFKLVSILTFLQL